MTTAELDLANDKLRAEIEHIRLQSEKARVELNQKMGAEIGKLFAETAKLNNERQWYLIVVGSGLTLAVVAVVRLFMVP